MVEWGNSIAVTPTAGSTLHSGGDAALWLQDWVYQVIFGVNAVVIYNNFK